MKKLPKEKVLLILAGPRRHYIINECGKNNIPYIFIGDFRKIKNKKDDVYTNILKAKKMNLLYNLIDCYLVTSKSEGGPKGVVESIMSGSLVLSTDVGWAKEYLHPNLIIDENKPDATLELLRKIIRGEISESSEYLIFSQKRVANTFNQEFFIQKYEKLFNLI